MEVDWTTLSNVLSNSIGFLSDLVTAVIGVATIYAFFRYRSRISAALRLIRFHHLNDRRNEIKQTLDIIAVTPIIKGRALEVRSLFGRLNGQLMPLCNLIPELQPLQTNIEEIAHHNGKLNEPIKQQIVHHIHAQFESARYQSLGQAAGDKS